MKKIITLLLTILILCNSAFTLNTIRADEYEDNSEGEVEIIPLSEEENEEEMSDEETSNEESSETEEETGEETIDIVSLLETLPAVEEINEDNYASTYEQFISLREIIDSLTEEEKSVLDLTEYNALEAYFNNENTEIEEENNEDEPVDNPPQESEETEEENHILNYIDDEIDTELLLHEDDIELNGETLPASYDLRNYNLVTSVKNQGSYGTCWAFATIASAESNYLKKTGTTLDLSELHLAWYGYNSYNKSDPQNLITNDGARTISDPDTLQVGGNTSYATMIMASGIGLNNESDYPYNTAYNYTTTNYNGTACYDADYYLDNARWVSMSESNYVKELIMNYGAVATSFQYLEKYYSTENDSYYAKVSIQNSGHAVTIVGWDDNYSKNNFTYTPNGNGAWLCKNSWGPNSNDNGYFWISYYDQNIVNSTAVSFSVEENNGSTYIYQYDGGINTDYTLYGSTVFYEGNVYTAKRTERIKKVGFFNANANTSYTVYILKNIPTNSSGTVTSPWGTEVCATVSGTANYAGYITVDLNEYPLVNANEKYSVVIKRTCSSGVNTYVDTSGSNSSIHFYASTSQGQSFHSYNGSTWSDYYSSSTKMTARIKAYTDTNLYLTSTEDSVNLMVGSTHQMSLTSNLNSTNYSFSSADSTIAVVDDDGLITGIGAGLTTITATCKGLSVSMTVNVATPASVPAFTVSIDDEGEIILECADSDYLNAILDSPDALKTIFYKNEANNTNEVFNTNEFYAKEDETGKLYFDATRLTNNTSYISLRLNVKGYAELPKVVYITTKAIAPSLSFVNSAEGLTIIGDSNYISTITSILIDGNTTEFFSNDNVSIDRILIPAEDLIEAGITTNTYNFTISSSYYYNSHNEFALVVTPKTLPAVSWGINGEKTYYRVLSDKDWLDGLFEDYSRGSRIKYYYRGVYYDVPTTAITRTDDTTVSITIADVKAVLPGVNGREYKLYFYSRGYEPYIMYMSATTGLTPKATDIIYATFCLSTGNIVQSYIRGQGIPNISVPSVEYKHFVYFVDKYNNIKPESASTLNMTEDQVYTPVYEYDIKVSDVVASIPSAIIENNTRVSLSSDEDAVIYYTLDGTDPTNESNEYTGSILIDESIATENTVTIKAIAVKENCEDSDIASFTYTIEDESADWGEILESDQNFESPSEVPTGLWAAGITDKTYDVKTKKYVQSDYRIYYGKTLLTEKTDYTVSYSGNTKVGTAKLIIKCKGNYSGTKEFTFTINPVSLTDGYTATLSSDVFAYTGKTIKPSLTVMSPDGKTKLKEKTDYTYTLENSIVASDTPYTLTITGKGNYKDTLTLSYTITTSTLISKAKITGIADASFDGEEHRPEPVLKIGSVTLIKDSDYTLVYDEDCISVGKHTLTITGIGDDYAGTVTKTYSIKGISASKFVIGGLSKSYKYGEEPQDITVTCKNGKTVTPLTEGTHYSLEILNGDKVGTATIVITGLESGGYTGTKKVTYKVTGTDIAGYTLRDVFTNRVYNGEAQTQEIALQKLNKKTNELEGIGQETGILLSDYNELTEEEKLAYNYTIEYKNNVSKGKATVIIRGVNAYTGSITKTFSITAKSLNGLSIDPIDAQTYLKGGVKPDVTIMDEEYQLVNNVDYTLKYSNNTSVASKKSPTVTITGKGNYAGTKTCTFTIAQSDISNLTLKVNDKAYTSKKGNYTQSITITDTDGKTLKAGTDYEKTLICTYVNKTVLANGTVRTAGETVSSSDVVPAGTAIRVTAYGKGNYTGSVSKTYRIVTADISKATVTIISQYYSGKEVELDKSQIIIKLNNEILSDTDYRITSYNKNISAGTATITLQGLGDYGGSKSFTFKIQSKPIVTTIVLNSNGGSGTMKNITVTSAVTALPSNTYSRKGYTFVGWNTRADGRGISYDNTESLDSISYREGNVLTLYAVWQKDIYSITYDIGEDVDNTNTVTSYSVDTKTITLKAPIRYRLISRYWYQVYVFEGWYKDANFKTKVTSIPKGSTGDITLYPKWSYLEGWINEDIYQKKDGSFATGIYKVGTTEYYFSTDGKLKKNASVKVSDKYYFTDSEGKIVKNCWWTYNLGLYHVDSKGVTEKGFKTYKEKVGNKTVSNTYYLDPYSIIPGVKTYGWKEISGKYYYFDADTGVQVKKSWVDNNQRYVDEKGVRVTNKILKIGNYSYYFNSEGYLPEEGYITYGNKEYYVTSVGYLAINTIAYVGDELYYFDKNGQIKTGMITYQGRTYYFWEDGPALIDCWVYHNNKWYITGDDGSLYKNGTYEIHGYDYTFDKNGVVVSYEVYEDNKIKVTYKGYDRTVYKYINSAYTKFQLEVENKTSSQIQYFQLRDESVNDYECDMTCSSSIGANKTKTISFTLNDSNIKQLGFSFGDVLYIDTKFHISFGYSDYYDTSEVRIHVNH